MPRATITIYADDDFERLADLRNAVDRAERDKAALNDAGKTTTLRYGDADPDALRLAGEAVDAAKAEVNALIDEASERADYWEVRSIGFEAWRKLLAAHPPRKVTEGEGDEAKEVTDPDDLGWAVVLQTKPFNTETLGKALVSFVDPEDDEHRTITKIGDAVPTDLAKRLRRLSQGQFETLWVTAYQLNVGGVADPLAIRYSIAARSSEP